MKRTPWEWTGRFALPAYFALVLLYLLLPMLLVIPMSVSETRYLRFPPQGFTFKWYASFFGSSGWVDATIRSVLIATLCTFLSTVLGTLAALGLGQKHVAARIGGWIFLAPQIVPVIILALGTLLVFNRVGLYGSIVGIVCVHSVLALPFVITTVSAALRQSGDTLFRAARSLGAKPHQAFIFVTLPIIKPAVTVAAIFSFFVSFDELVIGLFILGRNETLPMRIWADVRQDLTPVVAAVASLLICATFAAVLLAEAARQRSEARFR